MAAAACSPGPEDFTMQASVLRPHCGVEKALRIRQQGGQGPFLTAPAALPVSPCRDLPRALPSVPAAQVHRSAQRTCLVACAWRLEGGGQHEIQRTAPEAKPAAPDASLPSLPLPLGAARTQRLLFAQLRILSTAVLRQLAVSGAYRLRPRPTPNRCGPPSPPRPCWLFC